MLSAIQFDDQSGLKTHEIDNVPPDGHLPSELATFETSGTQLLPQGALGLGRAFSQLARQGIHAG